VPLFAALLALALGLAYANSFQVPFLMDDDDSISNNPTIVSFRTALFPPGDSGATVSGRPLLNLSFAVNWRLGGRDVTGYHVGNLLIHFGAALLLFGVVRRTLRLPVIPPRIGEAATPLAGFSALLWAVHPLQTESVTYIVQRAESLVALFFLGALYAFIRAVTATSRGWAIVAGVACFMGMAAKEVMAAAPLVLILYDRTFLSGTFREAWRRHGRMHLVFLSGWLLLGALVVSSGARGATVGFGKITWLDYLLTQGPGITLYLVRAFVPVNLVFDYGVFMDRRWLIVIPGTVFIAGLVAATVLLVRRRPQAGFLGAWFILILGPTSSVVPVVSQTLAEHRMYLPLAAVIVGVAVAAWHVIGRRAWVVLGGVALALCIGTFDRNRDYRTPLAIWSDTVAKVPDNARAHNNLGIFLREAGRTEEALEHLSRAVDLAPTYALAHSNLGITLVRATLGIPQTGEDFEVGGRRQARAERVAKEEDQRRRVDAGLEYLRLSTELDPGNARLWSNLGTALFECGRADESLAAFQRAVALEPDNSAHPFNLANAFAEVGRLEEAAKNYEASLRMNPDQPDVLTNYAIILRWMERWPQALERLHAARDLSPNSARIRSNLGVVLLAAGRPDEGMAELKRALEMNPDLPQARYHLGLVLGQRGQVDEAIVHFEALLKSAPPTAELWSNLGVLYAQAGRIEQAVAATEQALALDPAYEAARDNLARLRAYQRGLPARPRP